MERDKWRCEECGWVGHRSEVLEAPNPFDPTGCVWGCPNCLDVNTLNVACEHPGCEREASCGAPGPEAYDWTCYEHTNPIVLRARDAGEVRPAAGPKEG